MEEMKAEQCDHVFDIGVARCLHCSGTVEHKTACPNYKPFYYFTPTETRAPEPAPEGHHRKRLYI